MGGGGGGDDDGPKCPFGFDRKPAAGGDKPAAGGGDKAAAMGGVAEEKGSGLPPPTIGLPPKDAEAAKTLADKGVDLAMIAMMLHCDEAGPVARRDDVSRKDLVS